MKYKHKNGEVVEMVGHEYWYFWVKNEKGKVSPVTEDIFLRDYRVIQ